MSYQNEIQNSNHKLSLGEQRVKSIKKYLSENMAADLHVLSVAQKFKLSISSFHHIFKKYQGQSYRKYLEEIRINKASDLLQTEGIRIKEVMYATGYKNRTTFNNAFKKRFKQPPSYFKK